MKISETISSHEELSAILRGIAKNSPRFITAFIKPRSKYWPRVRSLCKKSSPLAVEVDSDTFVATWSGDNREMRALGDIVRLAHDWQSFQFYTNGKLHKQTYGPDLYFGRFYFWIQCYAQCISAPQQLRSCGVFSNWHTRYGIWSTCKREAPYDSFKKVSSKVADIQRTSANLGLVVCPNFKPRNFRYSAPRLLIEQY